MKYASHMVMTILMMVAAFFLFPALSSGETAAESSAVQKTIGNLNTALKGETNAVNRYTLFASKADQEGYSQVAKLFRTAAKSEDVHRQNHITAIRTLGGTPANIALEKVNVRSTRENLQVPIRGEQQELSVMYPRFIQQAQTAGAQIAVRSFTNARNSEMEHEKLFRDALANLGHMKNMDYYVNKTTGETFAQPAGARVARFSTDQYYRFG